MSEASGLAASARNPGVLWTHNDGSRRRLFGIRTNGVLLANLNFNREASDVEAIAAGPGPTTGVSYVYIGDIGGSGGTNTACQQVRVLRAPEPEVDLALTGNPISGDLAGELSLWGYTGQQMQATNNTRLFFEAEMKAPQRFFRVRVE